ncbi:MAG: DUF3501 family protein [Alphaproteobacteria bacterium]
MTAKTEITRADILPLEEFAKIRKSKRQELVDIKKNRRIEVGPVATFYFENYHTMWWQVQEMLFIEKGGEEQIPDELAAYNPLIPKGRELVCTVMFEIDEPIRRADFLAKLGGVEESAFLEMDGAKIAGVPEADVDRTSEEGKASSVQFIHFPFTDDQVRAFRAAGTQVVIGFRHPQYSHMAIVPEPVRQALAADFSQ